MARRHAERARSGRAEDIWLDGREITALAPDADGWWVLADGRDVVRFHGDAVETIASIEGEVGPVPASGGWRGARRHGERPAGDGARRGRSRCSRRSTKRRAGTAGTRRGEGLPTPGRSLPDPTAPCSRTCTSAGSFARDDPDGAWEPTIDIDADVHQVLADPIRAGHVVAATALGLAESSDAGGTWRFTTEGLHAPYARAVALDGDACS